MENLKYGANLAKYHFAQASVSETGKNIAYLATVAALTFSGYSYIYPAPDDVGTNNRDQAFKQLVDEKQNLTELFDEYQQIRMDLRDTNAEEHQSYIDKSNELKLKSKTFFAHLLTSGSMGEGLDVSEADILKIVNDLQEHVGDFDWDKHVNPNISTIIEYIKEDAGFLDEARAEHRVDVVDSVNYQFKTAFEVANNADMKGNGSYMSMFLAGALSLVLGVIAPITIESKEPEIKRMRPPRKPDKPKNY